jgi:hypothetical protein
MAMQTHVGFEEYAPLIPGDGSLLGHEPNTSHCPVHDPDIGFTKHIFLSNFGARKPR